ncbi:hypothetical protein HLH26_14590 [Gluconacetobacter sp. 1b LMG 1731]|uniref:Tripartite tricarboxylate transporter substrate binding protein n=1 Tax=Gluconacetobacter dulcium TaxID=2729096 RepID=A0A7W4IMV0_9PROT|nr:hypothetical protein [Gluconacetobacter dulcium]MBB2165742.1 hypothetical protein [Gluconacetobacter dulcium]MBB2194833.1 hypothetical protein [Gluconacetobacter dulcium]MBB2198634.1 hypothetical protein [Gluconacetobacter dulcium]
MRMHRRQFLAMAGFAALAGIPAAARAGGLTHIAAIAPAGGTVIDPTLLVAGSAESAAGRWSTVLAPALAQGLGSPAPLATHLTSGLDGVTGANQFDTQTVPDGATALLVPGAALVASLAGDPRAHYDFGRWVPLLFSLVSPIVVGRADLHRTLRDLVRDRPIRVAVSSDHSIELATVMAMAIFGFRPIPVTGFATPQEALTALRDGKVDVVQISDPMPPQTLDALLAPLEQTGATPLFTLTDNVRVTVHGTPVPSFAERFNQERGRPPAGLLYDAWKIVAAAASLDIGLMLPMLTPPEQVAGWRHAVGLASSQGALDTLRNDAGRTLVSGPDCGRYLHDMTGEITAVLMLRRWLAVHTAEWRLG